ncbi:MAG TPA: iron ABC transporter permease [Microbacteriaceae bacterium]|nr:iron ABC transporter permease [Microbacteriaceae bacterium]
MTRSRSAAIVVVAMAVLLLGAVLASALLGQLPVTPAEVGQTILRALGVPLPVGDPVIEGALQVVRFPRILLTLLVGAALAVAGVAMQAVFGNPLAEPGVVGISAGAAFGAGIAIALGLSGFGIWTTAVFAFLGALGAAAVVYLVARSQGRTEVVTLLLTGIAVNAFAGAGLALMLFLADSGSREQIVFWQLGSMSGSRWPEVGIVAAITVITGIGLLLQHRRYDLLALGERGARHLGVDVERLRVVTIVGVALLTGAAVAFCGIISFVGLVVPHLIRMMIGPGHRGLILASAVGGALLLTVADLLARTLVTGADLPIGMLTSLVGGPFFFWLLYRQRRRSGGWA